MATSFALLSLALAGLTSAAASSDKRGLCYVDSKHPSDYKIWTQKGSDLTWYYNYSPLPATTYSKLKQEEFEFVPMMWGIGANPDDATFLKQVQSLIKGGRNVTHVLGFNEPNAKSEWGGSNIQPKDAARAWVANFEPLGKMGVKLGLPACMGSWDALPWLTQFTGNCSKLISGNGRKKNCTWDFLPVHWYDNFGGLQSHINERRAAFPGTEIWITEYAYAHQEPGPTKQFLDQTLKYFDQTSWIGRYTYFGAFRSDVSNVGPNAPFLDENGKLTAIGQEYLGINGTETSSNDNASAPGLLAPGWLALATVAFAVVLTEIFS